MAPPPAASSTSGTPRAQQPAESAAKGSNLLPTPWMRAPPIAWSSSLPAAWPSLQLRAVWEYRELLVFLVSREVKGRYRDGLRSLRHRSAAADAGSACSWAAWPGRPRGRALPHLHLRGRCLGKFFANATVVEPAASSTSSPRSTSRAWCSPIAAVSAGGFGLLCGAGRMHRHLPRAPYLAGRHVLRFCCSRRPQPGAWPVAGGPGRQVPRCVHSAWALSWISGSTPLPWSIPPRSSPERWRTLYRLNPLAGGHRGLSWAVGTGGGADWTVAVAGRAYSRVARDGRLLLP